MLSSEQVKLLYQSLGHRIKTERLNRNLKQGQFAMQLKISRASLVNIEKGRQRAPLHLIYSLSSLLKVELSDLLPEVKDFPDSSLNKETIQNIKKTSQGDPEMEDMLFQFVNSTKKEIK